MYLLCDIRVAESRLAKFKINVVRRKEDYGWART